MVHIHPPESGKPKVPTQMISLIFGSLLFVLGLAGILSPSFAGLHMSLVHSIIIALAGAILFYNGHGNDSWKSFLSCLIFGLFFGIHAIVGFVMGGPGVPQVSYHAPDTAFLRIIPNFKEFGKADHTLNAILGVVLLGGALDWFKRHSERTASSRISSRFADRRKNLAHR
jgi:hypothetical protein